MYQEIAKKEDLLKTEKIKYEEKKEEKKEEKTGADEEDIEILKKYGRGPYTEKIKTIQDKTKEMTAEINKLCGIRESNTGLSLPQNWVIGADQQAVKSESLMVGRITKIIDPDTDHTRYIVNLPHRGKFVVDLSDQLSPTYKAKEEYDLKQKYVTIDSDRSCDLCKKKIGSTIFVVYPNLKVYHSKCAPNIHIDPSTGSDLTKQVLID